PFRLAIANANVPDMLSSISHALGRRKINIHNMQNKSRGEMAYTLVDADSPVPSDVIKELAALNGVLSVRYLPVDVCRARQNPQGDRPDRRRARRADRAPCGAGEEGRRAQGRRGGVPPRARKPDSPAGGEEKRRASGGKG